jgi:hypothetical protein
MKTNLHIATSFAICSCGAIRSLTEPRP